MTYTCTRPGCGIRHEGQAYCPTCTAEIKQNLAEQRLAQGTAAPCSRPSGACHGGHTINVGLDQARPDEDRLRTFVQYGRDAEPEEVTAMATELLALRAALADRDVAYQRAEQLEADAIADAFGIQGLATEDGVATLTTKPTTERARHLVLTMSLACGKMLDDDQAPNYVEFEVSPANRPGYVVHVRRAGGPSPHSLRREAEARVAELEALVDRVCAALNNHPRCDVHPDTVISCGWKLAVADVQRALEEAE